MDSEYEGILGITVTGFDHGYRAPIIALIIGHKDISLTEAEVGFDIHSNNEPNIQILKPIDKALEELLDNYQTRGHCDEVETLRNKLDTLHWLGYAYVMKNWAGEKIGKPPLLIVSATRFINLDIWKEIPTIELIKEINDRTNVVGEKK